MKTLDIELLRKELFYNPFDGCLYRRSTGEEALTALTKGGYKHGYVLSTKMYAHRVIWAMYYGEWPDRKLDHKDKIRTNNKIDNLRKATDNENAHNCSKPSNNTSGYKGVSLYKRDGTYEAYVKFRYVKYRAGYFSTVEEAVIARDALAAKLHGDFHSPASSGS